MKCYRVSLAEKKREKDIVTLDLERLNEEVDVVKSK